MTLVEKQIRTIVENIEQQKQEMELLQSDGMCLRQAQKGGRGLGLSQSERDLLLGIATLLHRQIPPRRYWILPDFSLYRWISFQ